MKRPLTLLLAAAALAAISHADESARPPMRDAATHDQLVSQLLTAQKNDPMKRLQSVTTPDPVVSNPPKDLISDSEILCFGGMATLVPKRAVLSIPANLENRLQYQTAAKILSWLEFYSQNRGWITTLEVTQRQAEGKQPLAKDIAEQVRTSAALVVATFQGGPISVLPLVEPPADTSPGEPTTTTTTDTPTATPTPTSQIHP